MAHNIKKGDIFVNSWGYDQTNIDYYKVVGVTEKSVKIRKLKSKETETGFMSGDSIPTNQFAESKTQTKRVLYSGDEPYLRLDYGWTGLWDGSPQRYSNYA